jgi:ribose transport system substrate-binding protein
MEKKFKKSGFPLAVLFGLLFLCSATVVFAVKKQPVPNNSSRKFGATYMTMNNPYFQVMNNSIEEAIESNGDILIARDPAQNQAKQNSQVQEMIREGVSAVFLNPVDWKGVKPALIACRKAGIPVFNIDTYVYNREYVTSIIASDNFQAGAQCAVDLMKKESHADIVILDCPKMQSIRDRVQGFKDKIAGNSNFRIVAEESGGGELEISMSVMDRIVHSSLKFNVILGGNDPTALGSLAALQKNHKSRIMIYGVDGSPDAKNMIKEGLLEGTSMQRPIKIGTTAVKIAYDYLSGKKVPQKITIPVTMVTKDNLGDFDINGWQ